LNKKIKHRKILNSALKMGLQKQYAPPSTSDVSEEKELRQKEKYL